MKNLFILLLIFTLFGCKQSSNEKINKKESFSISGTINGEYSDYIYLNYGKTKDSVKVKNNNFEFEGTVEKPIQATLNLKVGANLVARPARLYIENSDIKIEADYKKGLQDGKSWNILDIKDIKGSYSAEIQKEYQEFYQANENKENFKSLLYDKLEIFVEKNKSHPFSGTILGELALIEPILSVKELMELYSKIDTLQQNKDDLEMFKMGIANLNKYGVGKSFLKFELPNIKDKEIDITTFLGKITLVDFWASWCGPCRIKHPDLIKLKKKFEIENFDIVSVSIDDKKALWLKAVEKDNLTWTNLLDIKKEVYDELGIIGIPFNYLIDDNGIVLGINLSIEQVDRLISEKISM